MSSLSSASATAGGTETVEGLLRRCSLNLKSFSNGLSDTKTTVQGLTDFHKIVKDPKTTPQAFNDGLLRLLRENWKMKPWDLSFARIYHYGTGTGFAVRATSGAGKDGLLEVVDALKVVHVQKDLDARQQQLQLARHERLQLRYALVLLDRHQRQFYVGCLGDQ